MSDKPLRPAAAFAGVYPMLAEDVRALGYALAVHGSMARDLDLVAVPWTEDAAEPEAVAEAIRAAIDGWVDGDPEAGETRAHGRRCWMIWFHKGNSLFPGAPYIDLSVMPRQAPPRERRRPVISQTTPVRRA